jgi:hypothetical protein
MGTVFPWRPRKSLSLAEGAFSGGSDLYAGVKICSTVEDYCPKEAIPLSLSEDLPQRRRV